MTKNLNFENVITLLFGEEEMQEMKARAEKRAAIDHAIWKKEMQEIMDNLSENDDIIEEEGEELMKHKILMDTEARKTKPTVSQTREIQNRIFTNPVELTIKEIAHAQAVDGKSIKASYLTGSKNDSFVSASLLMLDIDNKDSKTGLRASETYLSYKDFMARCKDLGLAPAVVYNTFSHSKEWDRYRAIFQLPKVYTDAAELDTLYRQMQHIFPEADKAIKIGSLSHGGKKLLKLNTRAILDIDKVEELAPAAKFAVKAAKTKEKTVTNTKTTVITEKFYITKDDVIRNLKASDLRATMGNRTVDNIEGFEYINRVPLTVILGVELNTLFRCLKHNHTDNNPSTKIIEMEDGTQRYVCSSCPGHFKRQTTIDALSDILNLDPYQVKVLIADALNIELGSEYQQQMRAMLTDIEDTLTARIKEDSDLDKFMRRSNLYQVFTLMLQFARRNVSYNPMGADDKCTFFMSCSQLSEEMTRQGVKGNSITSAKNKIMKLKDLGFLRPLLDVEVSEAALTRANKEREKMLKFKMEYAKERGLTLEELEMRYGKTRRVDFLEIQPLTPELIDRANEYVKRSKKAKQSKNNMIRKAFTHGVDVVQESYAQDSVAEVVLSKRVQKKAAKVLDAATLLIEQQGYFTEDQLRKTVDPKAKMKKSVAIQMINDYIPYVMTMLDIKKDRVNSSTREKHSISKSIKSNVTIYC